MANHNNSPMLRYRCWPAVRPGRDVNLFSLAGSGRYHTIVDIEFMASVATHAPSMGSRLTRLLAAMDVSAGELTHRNFTDQLGQMIDLSDSISLAEALRSLPRLPFTESDEPALSQRDEFLQARRAMVEFIAKSFVGDGVSPAFALPAVSADADGDGAEDLKLLVRFYSLQQSELETRIAKLRVRVRGSAALSSRKLAQLVALDEALGDTLTMHTRKLFAAIPRLLGERFRQLRSHGDEAWLDQFHSEMQGLLLAELDLRLQPVLGLVEALDVEVDGKQ